jgi:hypothetical protein
MKAAEDAQNQRRIGGSYRERESTGTWDSHRERKGIGAEHRIENAVLWMDSLPPRYKMKYAQLDHV